MFFPLPGSKSKIRGIFEPFSVPVWDHAGSIVFRIEPALYAISFKVNDEPWITIDAGSRACTHALLAVAERNGVHKRDGEATFGGMLTEVYDLWSGKRAKE